jgi:hypothetical protein
VVTLLATLHAAKASSAAAGGGAQGQLFGGKYNHALAKQAAQLGSTSVATRAPEAVAPVVLKLRAKLFRKPKTLLSFFGSNQAKAGSNAKEQQASSAACGLQKRKSSELHTRCSFFAQNQAPTVRSQHCQGSRVGTSDTASHQDGKDAVIVIDGTPVKKAPRSGELPASSAVGGEDARPQQEVHTIEEKGATEAATGAGRSGADALSTEASVMAQAAEEAVLAADPKDTVAAAASRGQGSFFAPCAMGQGAAHRQHTVGPFPPAESLDVDLKPEQVKPLVEKQQNAPRQIIWGKYPQKKSENKNDSSDVDDAAYEKVLAMGFRRTDVQIALKTCRGNPDRAIEFLLNR